jgi:hypothetical protein
MIKRGQSAPKNMPKTDFNMKELEKAMSYDDDFEDEDEEMEDCTFPELKNENKKSFAQKTLGHLETESLKKALEAHKNHIMQ